MTVLTSQQEDENLTTEIETLVSLICSKDEKSDILRICELIKTATSSMTSVPKPLKYLQKHYGTLIARLSTCVHKVLLADVLSVLSMTSDSTTDTLQYRLLGSTSFVEWGHEYCKHLSLQIISNYHNSSFDSALLVDLATHLVPFFLKHNAEADACDLLIELEHLHLLVGFVDKLSFKRVCLYIVGCSRFVFVFESVSFLFSKIFTSFL